MGLWCGLRCTPPPKFTRRDPNPGNLGRGPYVEVGLLLEPSGPHPVTGVLRKAEMQTDTGQPRRGTPRREPHSEGEQGCRSPRGRGGPGQTPGVTASRPPPVLPHTPDSISPPRARGGAPTCAPEGAPRGGPTPSVIEHAASHETAGHGCPQHSAFYSRQRHIYRRLLVGRGAQYRYLVE